MSVSVSSSNVLSMNTIINESTHCTAEELFKLTETELGIFSTQEGADNSMVTRSTIIINYLQLSRKN